MSDDSTPFVPGLAGVAAAKSRVCFLDGTIGKLQYRGYPIEVLAEKCSYEEVVFLLFEDRLPTAKELDDFRSQLAAERALAPETKALLEALRKNGHPMAALGAALVAEGMRNQGDHVKDAAYRRATAVRLVAQFPTLVAAWQRIRNGRPPVEPNPELGHAASFLHLMTGEAPDELAAHVMNVALVLHAEHTMNASTFSCRVVGSTLASMYTTSAAAVGALSGALHGGANERVLASLRQIDGGASGAQAWAEGKLARKEKIMGFGHRVYKVKDPRATILQGLAGQLFEKFGATPLYDVAVGVERAMEQLVGAKGIYPNVDFFSGIVYERLGIPTDVFTPIFAIARISGWLAHLLEQLDDNRIFRPTQIWTGELDRAWVDVDAR